MSTRLQDVRGVFVCILIQKTGQLLLQSSQDEIQSLLQTHHLLELQVLNLERKINLMILNRKLMDEAPENVDEDIAQFFEKLHPLGSLQSVCLHVKLHAVADVRFSDRVILSCVAICDRIPPTFREQ